MIRPAWSTPIGWMNKATRRANLSACNARLPALRKQARIRSGSVNFACWSATCSRTTNRNGTAPLDRFGAFVRFQRGLIVEGSFRAEIFSEHAGEILEAVPTLTHLRLRDAKSKISLLAELPEMESITGLELPMGFPRPDDLKALVSSPHLKRLRTLSLANCLLGRHVEILAGSTVLQTLTHINLECNRLNHDGLELLLNSVKPGHLRSLTLARNNLDRMAVTPITPVPFLWQGKLDALEELDLSGNSIGAVGINVLTESKHLIRLRKLRMSNCQIGDQGLNLFWQSEGFPELTSLDLSCNRISSSLNALEQSGWLGELRELNLSRNPLNHSDLAHVLQVIDPSRLVRLNLSHTQIRRDGKSAVKNLGYIHPMPRLRELNLSYCNLDTKTLVFLIESTHFEALEVLNLGGNHITNHVAAALLKAEFLNQLQKLFVTPPFLEEGSYYSPRKLTSTTWKELKARLGDRIDVQ